jgi:hypothetical protein
LIVLLVLLSFRGCYVGLKACCAGVYDAADAAVIAAAIARTSMSWQLVTAMSSIGTANTPGLLNQALLIQLLLSTCLLCPADITAKNTSQYIFASLFGTAAGVSCCAYIGQSAPLALLCFSGLAYTSMYSAYRTVKSIPLPTLNSSRLQLLAARWGTTGCLRLCLHAFEVCSGLVAVRALKLATVGCVQLQLVCLDGRTRLCKQPASAVLGKGCAFAYHP